MTRRIVHLALGSNLSSAVGDRRATLVEAIRRLAADPTALVVTRRSAIYETPPVPPGQPAYLNAAIAVETALTLPELLTLVQGVERSLGRERLSGVRWGPRTIDIDLLLDGESVHVDEGPPSGSGLPLTVPHPRLAERLFVLVPLAEIAPDARVPPAGTPVRRLLEAAVATEGQAARDAIQAVDPRSRNTSSLSDPSP